MHLVSMLQTASVLGIDSQKVNTPTTSFTSPTPCFLSTIDSEKAIKFIFPVGTLDKSSQYQTIENCA
jgi:hypothetical protein